MAKKRTQTGPNSERSGQLYPLGLPAFDRQIIAVAPFGPGAVVDLDISETGHLERDRGVGCARPSLTIGDDARLRLEPRLARAFGESLDWQISPVGVPIEIVLPEAVDGTWNSPATRGANFF